MPHLLDSEPPMLSIERGISSTVPLGHDILIHRDDPDLEQHIGRMRGAIARLVDTTDPDLEIIRKSIDARYLSDNEHLPDDFAFTLKPGESITELLARSDDIALMAFAVLNSLRMWGQREVMLDYLPDLHEDGVARADRLRDGGIISHEGRDLIVASITDITDNQRVRPLDSFEGGHLMGSANGKGIYLSNMFDSSQGPIRPTAEYFHIAFHEDEHYARETAGLRRPDGIQLIEEFIVEHHAVISGPTDGVTGESVLSASNTGFYRGVRRLLGLALKGPKLVCPEILGEALVSDEHSTAYLGIVRALQYNFNQLFPEYRGEAFETYLKDDADSMYGHVADEIAWLWGNRVAGRLTA